MTHQLIAAIVHTETGEVRDYRYGFDWSWNTESMYWQWTEGNYSCDCALAEYFAEAGGEPDPDIPCSDGLYIVESLEVNGKAIL